jgi:DNA polymerase-1
MILYLDLETNTKHNTIWCAAYAIDDSEPCVTREQTEVASLLAKADTIVNHNLIGFDLPVLERVWGIRVPFKKMTDTLVMSRLYDPAVEGGHSLEAWGNRIGCPKGDFRDYDSGYSDEMAEYAKRDIIVTRKLYRHLHDLLALEGFSEQSILLEHQVAFIVERQVRHGVTFEFMEALSLRSTLEKRMQQIEEEMQVIFPPIVTERISEKTGKKLKDNIEVFNPGSRPQIAARLAAVGVEFKEKTETGAPKVDEGVLEGIDRPEAKLILEYLMLQKRLGMVDSWIDACTPAGKIHGKVLTNGAVTGRMTHYSPNLAQIPAVSAPYGKECRSLFVVPPGKVMVGVDASALELCMLAHYMNDEGFTKSVVEGKKDDGSDVHSRNQRAAGLPTRDQAKTFIYALLYGAGPGKIGAIVGGGAKEGQQMITRFMDAMPKLAALKLKVERAAEMEKATLKGLDGRRVRIRSVHSALNTLLQSAGAIVMKQALAILYRHIVQAKLDAKFILNVHDEWQIEVAEDHAEHVSRHAVRAIREAGEVLKLRCPLTGEARVGKNWAETH